MRVSTTHPHTSIKRVVLALALCLTAASALAAKDGEVFKSWTVGCETSPDKSQEVCHIAQVVKDPESGRDMAQVAVGYFPASDDPVAIVTLPLGVHLPSGLQLQVDEGEEIRVPIEVCTPNGCQAGVNVKSPLRESLLKGATLKLTIHDPTGKAATLAVSLSGFTAGLGSLR
jgi:invasion protein IalB